ncbi:hypothetical protein FB639_005248, partial [Coemansia asiatica]
MTAQHLPNMQPSSDQSNLADSQTSGFNSRVLQSSVAAALSSLNFGWCLGEPNIPEDIIKKCIE